MLTTPHFTLVKILLILAICSLGTVSADPLTPPSPIQHPAPTDPEIIDFARDALELISSYTPTNAETRFLKLRDLLVEPGRDRFDKAVLSVDLPAIQHSRRTQRFVEDKDKTTIEHFPDLDDIVVRITGRRERWIELKPQSAEDVTYHLNIKINPPQGTSLKYHIVIKDIEVRPAGETFAFAGHISNKTLWMTAKEQEGAELTTRLERHEENTKDIMKTVADELSTLRTEIKTLEVTVASLSKQLERQQLELDELKHSGLRKQLDNFKTDQRDDADN